MFRALTLSEYVKEKGPSQLVETIAQNLRQTYAKEAVF
jgi:hypothetical protein